MSPMRWTPLAVQGTTPTIKNHSATVISKHEILVFGGYDGRRNHNELFAPERQDDKMLSPPPKMA